VRNISENICKEHQKNVLYIHYSIFSENLSVSGTARQTAHYIALRCRKDALFYTG